MPPFARALRVELVLLRKASVRHLCRKVRDRFSRRCQGARGLAARETPGALALCLVPSRGSGRKAVISEGLGTGLWWLRRGSRFRRESRGLALRLVPLTGVCCGNRMLGPHSFHVVCSHVQSCSRFIHPQGNKIFSDGYKSGGIEIFCEQPRHTSAQACAEVLSKAKAAISPTEGAGAWRRTPPTHNRLALFLPDPLCATRAFVHADLPLLNGTSARHDDGLAGISILAAPFVPFPSFFPIFRNFGNGFPFFLPYFP